MNMGHSGSRYIILTIYKKLVKLPHQSSTKKLPETAEQTNLDHKNSCFGKGVSSQLWGFLVCMLVSGKY